MADLHRRGEHDDSQPGALTSKMAEEVHHRPRGDERCGVREGSGTPPPHDRRPRHHTPSSNSEDTKESDEMGHLTSTKITAPHQPSSPAGPSTRPPHDLTTKTTTGERRRRRRR